MHKYVVVLGCAFLFACAASTSSKDRSIDKASLVGADGKADTDISSKICLAIGEDAGCDLCDLAGWYGDSECDTFCQQHDPDCGAVCGGRLGNQCEPDEFCDFALGDICGFADATGVCTAIPQICNHIYSPVCGCDGMTYSNTCTANSAGTSVNTVGECPPPEGEQCGADVCDAGEICCAGCPGHEPFGCQTQCPLIKCPAPGATCGGLLGAGCEAGEFCNYPLEAICGAADQTGTCAPTPDACTQQYDPVCGCDGNTYGNECTAHAAGISLINQGPCTR